MPKLTAASSAPHVASLASELRVTLGRLMRRLRAHAPPGDLTWPQLSVLTQLEAHGPATVTELARLDGMRPQSMGAIIAALESAGLLSGAPHPTDGRQVLLSLTSACRSWLKANRAAREDWLAQAIRGQLSAAEQAELARATGLLKRLLEG